MPLVETRVWDVQTRERLIDALASEARYLNGEGLRDMDMPIIRRCAVAAVMLRLGTPLLDEVGDLWKKEAEDPESLTHLEAVSMAVDYYDI